MIVKLRTQMRLIMGIVAAAFLVSTFLMYGSGSRGRSYNPGEGRSDYAVAEVNGRKLMASAMYELLRARMEGSGGRDVTSMDYQAVLEGYAMEQQMAKEVRDSGVTVTDAEAEQAMKEYADRTYPTREAFYQSLERSGRKIADYKKDISQQLVNQKFIALSVGTVTVSEDESVQFYDSMKNFFFRQPSGYNVNLAQFSSQAEAEKVRNLLSAGSAWNEATSGDVVASSDVIEVTREPRFFADSAFDGYLAPMKSMDLGAVSPVFEIASNDFAVGVISDRVEEKITSYEDVSADIRAIMQQQKGQDAVNNFGLGLLSRANIVILDQSLFPSEKSDFLPVTDTASDDSVSVPAAPVSGD